VVEIAEMIEIVNRFLRKGIKKKEYRIKNVEYRIKYAEGAIELSHLLFLEKKKEAIS